MKTEGRLFERYTLKKKNIKVYAFDKHSNFYDFPIELKDLSFTGIALESEIEFTNERLMLVIGKRMIKMKAKRAWLKKTERGFITGLNITIEDERSFLYWNTLLQAMNKIQHLEDSEKEKMRPTPGLQFSAQI